MAFLGLRRIANYYDSSSERVGKSTAEEELAEEFNSLSMMTSALLVINFHLEVYRSATNSQLFYQNRVFDHWRDLVRAKQTQIYLCHLVLLYSTYFSLYYLFIPFLVWWTVVYVFEWYYRYDMMNRYLENAIYIGKGVFIVFLCEFLYYWTAQDSKTLDVYHSELRRAGNLLVQNIEFFGLIVIFLMSRCDVLSLRICIVRNSLDIGHGNLRPMVEFFEMFLDFF